MECTRCESCGELFRPRAQVRDQRYCAEIACQRERKRCWQRDKRRTDPDYRSNQSRAQQAWAARHPDYWREYRAAHPEYVERNRVRQRERTRATRTRRVAKMDACADKGGIESGTYRLSPVVSDGVAKMDAWTVQITLLSTPLVT
jgi:hypothetical protein